MPNGLLLLNKPVGVRSTTCVAIARRRLGKTCKVGHGGSLDSTAEGLLVLLIGSSTRTSSLVMSLPKLYETTFLLGEERSTDDSSGETIFREKPPSDPRARIEALLPSFLGVRLQRPPEISAVRVEGRRAHEIARSGGRPLLRDRPVLIQTIALLPGEEAPNTFTLRVLCGKGTYIRSIVRDIGRLLGCGAHVLRLVRKRTGLLKLGESLPFEIFQDDAVDLTQRLTSLSRLAEHFFCYEADEEQASLLRTGRAAQLSSLRFRHAGILSPVGGVVVQAETLFSYGRILQDGSFSPTVNISTEGEI